MLSVHRSHYSRLHLSCAVLSDSDYYPVHGLLLLSYAQTHICRRSRLCVSYCPIESPPSLGAPRCCPLKASSSGYVYSVHAYIWHSCPIWSTEISKWIWTWPWCLKHWRLRWSINPTKQVLYHFCVVANGCVFGVHSVGSKTMRHLPEAVQIIPLKRSRQYLAPGLELLEIAFAISSFARHFTKHNRMIIPNSR